MRVPARARGVVVVGVMAGLLAVVLAVTLAALRAQRSLPAGGGDAHQSVEWAEGPGSVRWTVTVLGIGVTVSGDACDRDDYVMRINRRGNNAEPPDRYRIFASRGRVQTSFRGKSVVGHRLTEAGAYLCLGFRDTWAAGGPHQVAAHLLVWITDGVP